MRITLSRPTSAANLNLLEDVPNSSGAGSAFTGRCELLDERAFFPNQLRRHAGVVVVVPYEGLASEGSGLPLALSGFPSGLRIPLSKVRSADATTNPWPELLASRRTCEGAARPWWELMASYRPYEVAASALSDSLVAAYRTSDAITLALSELLAAYRPSDATASALSELLTCLHVGATVTPSVEENTEDDSVLVRLKQSLVDSFTEEPVEAGKTHLAEALLSHMLSIFRERAVSWIEEVIRREEPCDVAVGLLRCIGRMQTDQLRGWGFDLAASCLGSPTLEIRDAAIRALENWGGGEARAILEKHNEETPWLSEYIQRVVRDLGKR